MLKIGNYNAPNKNESYKKNFTNIKKKLISGIEKKLLGTLLNSNIFRTKIQGITKRKNKLSFDWSPENLGKLVSGNIKRMKCGKYFRINLKKGSKDTIILDLTRNLDELQKMSKREVLIVLIKEIEEIFNNLKANRKILDSFHKLEMTSRIFGQRNTYGLRENITNKFIQSIYDGNNDNIEHNIKLLKMTTFDKMSTMCVYPHDFLNIRHHKSKGKLIIDLDKKILPNVKNSDLSEKGELPIAI